MVKTGKSQAVRIPAAVIEQLQLGPEVDLVNCGDHLEVRRSPRSGWREQLREMAERGDDKMIDEPTATTRDNEEWEW